MKSLDRRRRMGESKHLTPAVDTSGAKSVMGLSILFSIRLFTGLKGYRLAAEPIPEDKSRYLCPVADVCNSYAYY